MSTSAPLTSALAGRRQQLIALARLQARLISTDAQPLAVLIAMPLLLVLFLRPTYRAALAREGYPGSSGAEQAVPGLAVVFSFLLVSYMGFEFFREHGHHTWERLRASAIRPGDLMAGKSLPFLALALIQYGVVFAAGALVFGMTVRGSVLALIVVCAALSVCVLTLGLMLIALSKTYQQMNSISTLGAFVLAGAGGAISPLPTLPSWIRTIGHATPTYWGMRAFRDVILAGRGIGAILAPVAILLAFSVGSLMIAAHRLRFDEEKVF
jgi:ABC-2 type transport system permease protein